MASNEGEAISCGVCCNFYLSESATSGLFDRRPVVVCNNGHSFCMSCAIKLKDSDTTGCPSCRGDFLSQPIINRALLDAVEVYNQRLGSVPEIDVTQLSMTSIPFASGAFADVYYAKWHTQDVVVKAMRFSPEVAKQTKLMALEANLAIGLHHPNIIRLFGTTTMPDKRFAIIMEKAEYGSLERHMKVMERQLSVRICLGVVDGLQYVHSRKVAHRDLKPENILLCGQEMTAKISDFGVAKVLQTLVTSSKEAGTPKYAAPELLNAGSVYGYSVDIFSLAVIIFELFSGLAAETCLGTTNIWQIISAIMKGARPTIPDDFPAALKPIVSRGWSPEPAARPPIAEFRSALQSMSNTVVNKPDTVSDKIVNVSMIDQSAEVAKGALPLPVISLKWNTSCEKLNSVDLRVQMVQDMGKKSNMNKIINSSVLCAFEVIPRHLFIHTSRFAGFTLPNKTFTEQDVVNVSYLYNKPMPATPNSNESSPEIIGTQLSMTEITQGQSVLLVGMKGGYIQSLVAQLVGIHGSVVTVTSDAAALAVCRDRVNAHCPFKGIVSWIQVKDVKKPADIVAAVKERKQLFHTIIYCGSVDHFPEELYSIWQTSGNVSLMVPVQKVFQLSIRREGVIQLKTITDFGVIFEGVH